MEKEEFTATEVIAGFPLVSIKRALGNIGLMNDRDTIKQVAEALSCPPRQAEGVLAALELRGFVTKAAKKKHWDVTPLGNRLRFYWKPPRKIEPVIERDEDSDAINESFESVWCSIFRSDSDNSITFEEAQFEVGVWVEYESERVIEISVMQPDYYDDPDSSCTVETSVYLGVTEAKKFAQGLQTAIERAEAEIARRAGGKPRKRRTTKEQLESNEVPSKLEDSSQESPRNSNVVEEEDARASKTKSPSVSSARATAKAAAAAVKKEEARKKEQEVRKKRESDALASTLAELRRAR